ncbi:MAG: GTP 3',8-cyclase MoaA [Myxococcota bacterium]
MSLPPRLHPPGAPTPNDGPLTDPFGRVHTYLRVSVTDRCNFRCTYCMPAEGLDWMPRETVLTFEELTRVVGIFVKLGVRKIRLTGGEPTIRKGIVELVRQLSSLEGLEDRAMTTNALRLSGLAQPLADAGLSRVNISIDSLKADRFREMTRGGDLVRVLAGIDAAIEAGLTPVKLNAVVMRNVNDDEVVDLVRHFADRPEVQVRFIEFMPFSAVERKKRHVPAAEMRARLGEHWELRPLPGEAHAGPSVNWELGEGGPRVGFISPITEHFCQACNRLRLQADGHLRTCLSREAAPSLRDLMRAGISDEALEVAIRGRIWGKVAGHEADQIESFRPFDGAMTSVGG